MFKAFREKWFGESKNSDYGPGESWGGEDHHHNSQMMSTAGGCLVFTMPNINPTEIDMTNPRREALLDHVIKIDPSLLHFADL
jgi:hypothetical protein